MRYDAFISYRHCELDQFVATNIHKKLENFKMPKSALPLIKDGRKRIERVFRDEDELPLSDNLSDPIEEALANSEFLIVICTPRLRESLWCKREIEIFLKSHDRKHILLVLAEGEPEQSFPEILTYEEVEETDSDGNQILVRRNLEPLAADVRGNSRREILKAMDIAVIKLVAAIFSLNYDDIKQRHREQKMRRLMAVWSVVTSVVFVFALVCLILLSKISMQKNEIQDKYASAMAKASQELMEKGRRQDAVFAVRNVLPDSGKYTNPDSYKALANAISPYNSGVSFVAENIFSIPSAVAGYCTSMDGSYIMIEGADMCKYIFDTETGELLYDFYSFCADNLLPTYAFDGNKGLIYSDVDGIFYLDLKNYKITELYAESGYVIGYDKCDTVTVLTGSTFAGYKKGKCIYEQDLSEYYVYFNAFTDYEYGFSYEGEHIVLALRDYRNQISMLMMNTGTGEVETCTYLSTDENYKVTCDGNEIYMVIDDFYGVSGYLGLVDAGTGEMPFRMEIPVNFCSGVKMVGSKLVIYSDANSIVVDTSNFHVIGQLDYSEIIVDVIDYKGSPAAINHKGRLYIFDDFTDYAQDITDNIFAYSPKEETIHCTFEGGAFFYMFKDSNYICRYINEPAEGSEKVRGQHFDYGRESAKELDASEELETLDNLVHDYVFSAIYSSDDKYILVMTYDRSLKIYDNSTKKLIKNVYSVSNITISSFVYIEEEDIYILNVSPYSHIFDSDLNDIAKMHIISGYEDGCFIQQFGEDYYRMPYIDYDEMIEMADKILEGYEPDTEIRKKYGF